MTPIIEARGLSKEFRIPGEAMLHGSGVVRALDSVDLAIETGEIVALVGESACGKTTLGRCLVRLEKPTAGHVLYAGLDLETLDGRRLRAWRRHCQIVFQDAASSLDPLMPVGEQIAEPLAVHRIVASENREGEVRTLLEEVGLEPSVAAVRPDKLSRGQAQRVVIARALACRPRFLVADEPVSALDAPAGRRILDLLARLRGERGLAVLLVSHDLQAAGTVADRICVMYRGRICEMGPAGDVLRRPLHPYSAALVSSVRSLMKGRLSHRIAMPTTEVAVGAEAAGCLYEPRCAVAGGRCARQVAEFRTYSSERQVACHFPGKLELPAGEA